MRDVDAFCGAFLIPVMIVDILWSCCCCCFCNHSLRKTTLCLIPSRYSSLVPETNMSKVIAVCVALLATAAVALQCPPCDQTVCASQSCGSAVPYYCEAGTSTGGCAPSPASWNNSLMCSSCCDTSSCYPTFSCGSCSVADCETTRRCSFSLPYMCTGGSSAFGCATMADFWPQQQTCSSCCNVKSCIKSCPPCTAAQCAIDPCTSAVPYFCAAGPLQGGCSASASYFGDAAQCYECCDSSSCTTKK
jgi:hypothetical protein